jgi:hypothetical protein
MFPNAAPVFTVKAIKGEPLVNEDGSRWLQARVELIWPDFAAQANNVLTLDTQVPWLDDETIGAATRRIIDGINARLEEALAALTKARTVR